MSIALPDAQAIFFSNVQLTTWACAWLSNITAPPLSAVQLKNVVFFSHTGPELTAKHPPNHLAVLLVKLLPMTLTPVGFGKKHAPPMPCTRSASLTVEQEFAVGDVHSTTTNPKHSTTVFDGSVVLKSAPGDADRGVAHT